MTVKPSTDLTAVKTNRKESYSLVVTAGDDYRLSSVLITESKDGAMPAVTVGTYTGLTVASGDYTFTRTITPAQIDDHSADGTYVYEVTVQDASGKAEAKLPER